MSVAASYKIPQIILLLILAVSLATTEDLEESESKDPGKIDIIKQIKRVNEDGSYTFGYETDDGTFKIESRDVLGNVKGTFGFVDSNGTIKRVSYTSNSTEQTSPTPTPIPTASVIQQIPKIRGNSTKRALFPSASSVIQSIPRKRYNGTYTSSSTTTERPSYKHLVSATVDTARPYNGHYITEGQLVRPTQQDLVTPRPTYLTPGAGAESTIKPLDVYDRGNLLLRRRQLNQREEIQPQPQFDTRQHVLNLQQSIGDDSTDVYSASVTTGTPRPLFTTAAPQAKAIYPAVYGGKMFVRVPMVQETTTDATTQDQSYVQPVPIIAVRHPYQQRTIFIPVNQLDHNGFIVEGTNDQQQQQHQYEEQQYEEQQNFVQPIPYHLVPRYRRPVLVAVDDQRTEPERFYPPAPYAHKISDDIDNIKPPVTTRDFQKLLNRLIMRQSQLQELSRMEQNRLQPTPISVFFRTRPDLAEGRKPAQFVSQQPRMAVQPQIYSRSGRRARLYQPEPEENLLPADVREMLLLRMLQLAINPNLPLPASEGENMVMTIQQHKKESVRNVEILGEEPEQDKPISRSKRYPHTNTEYY